MLHVEGFFVYCNFFDFVLIVRLGVEELLVFIGVDSLKDLLFVFLESTDSFDLSLIEIDLIIFQLTEILQRQPLILGQNHPFIRRIPHQLHLIESRLRMLQRENDQEKSYFPFLERQFIR